MGNWPLSFVAKPAVLYSNNQKTGTVAAFMEQPYQVTATSAGYTFLWCPRSRNNVLVSVNVMGIGRWK